MRATTSSAARARASRRELATLSANQSRGDASVDEIRADLQRVRAYAGLDPVAGPGVTITVRGPIDGTGVEELFNELRNAGAEAIAIGDVRVVDRRRRDRRGGRGADRRRRAGRRLRHRRDRGARQADGLADAVGRRHRPAGRDPARGRRSRSRRSTGWSCRRPPGPSSRRTGVRAFDTLTRRCQTSPSSCCSSATSSASVAPIPAARAPGWSIASARTSGCAARAAAGTCCSSGERSSAGWSSSSAAATRR